jgi:FANCI solenoid 2/FANCI helical domain 2
VPRPVAQFLGDVLLHIVRTCQVQLTPFCLCLLLAMAHLRRHHRPTLDFLHSHLLEQMSSLSHQFDSLALSSVIARHIAMYPRIGLLMNTTVANSRHFDSIQQYLVELAMSLLDTRCVTDRGNVARIDKISFATFSFDVDFTAFSPPVNAVFQGASIIRELFSASPQSQSFILDQLCDRISRNSNALPSIALLHRLVERNPEAFVSQRQRVLEWVDELVILPPHSALLFLRAILRLCHSSHSLRVQVDQQDTIRSRLLMTLKKLMFSSAPSARLLACNGVVCLIEAVLMGKLAGGCDEGGGSLSQSSQSSGPSIDVPLLMELLGLLRRSLSSTAAVKQALYAHLSALYFAYPLARSHIIDLLLPSFRYCQTDASAPVPFHLSQCVYQGNITEPLPHLVMSIVHALSTHGVGGEGEAVHNMRVTLRDCIMRMARLSMKEIGYSRSAIITAETDVSRPVLMHGLYQACMEFVLCCGQRGKEEGREQQVGDESWELFRQLFDRFLPLEDWLMGRGKDKAEKEKKGKEQEKGKPVKKKRKKDDRDDEDTESSEDEGGEEEKGSGRASSQSRKKAGKEEKAGKKKVKRIAVPNMLSPLALNLILRRLITQEHRDYVRNNTAAAWSSSHHVAASPHADVTTCASVLRCADGQPKQILIKDVDLQRFVLRGVSDRLVDSSATIAFSPLEMSISVVRDDLKRFARFLSATYNRLFIAINQLHDNAGKDEAGKKNANSVPAMTITALTKTITVAGQLGTTAVNEILEFGMQQSQQCICLLSTTRSSCRLLLSCWISMCGESPCYVFHCDYLCRGEANASRA